MMVKMLNQLQASLTIFYANAKNFHWNLQDIDFLLIHKYTDKLAQKTNDFIDEIAEKVRALDKIAISSFSEISQNSSFEQFPSKIWTTEEVLDKLASQIEKIIEICKEIQQSQASEIDYLVYPLIDEIVLYFHKELWKVYAQKPSS
ncbi:DNA protection during starvation protein [Mesomycoplasma dispar]|uniref:DNA protection during starvation protein n=1 Tax=Mesomycoplasma dispar TaxID=86660 RepID=A0AAJ5NQP2_9BACT|nr:DNA starvation/stationary phase protection protein [Mesomycoplasma dispar]VEU61722.1 DNA protection during starvation protein [Mesomycoplasma dispar]